MRIVLSESELRALVAGRPVYHPVGGQNGMIEIILSVSARPKRVPRDPPQAREFLPVRRTRRR